MEKVALEQTVADAASSMSAHHFCGSAVGMQIQMHIVTKQAVHSAMPVPCIELSCCSVFNGNPQSWMVLGIGRKESRGDWDQAPTKRLSIGKWIELMTAADLHKNCIYVTVNFISILCYKCPGKIILFSGCSHQT